MSVMLGSEQDRMHIPFLEGFGMVWGLRPFTQMMKLDEIGIQAHGFAILNQIAKSSSLIN